MSEKRYGHSSSDEKLLDMHDCCIDEISFEDGKLFFYFNEGVYIASDGRSDAKSRAKAVYMLNRGCEDDTLVYLSRKGVFGKNIVEEWKLERLINTVNEGRLKLEFLYQYKDEASGYIIKCHPISYKKPYYIGCQLELNVKDALYYWN